MTVEELITALKKMPKKDVVYYSNNDEFLDIDAIQHNPKEHDYEGFVILGTNNQQH
tara:strand:- start:14 stop:181 length:168 start_codon:yes stop_codon:yes gene_type:complete